MESKIVVVTPAVAREWLKRNVNNRPLRMSTVSGLKAAFMRGEYVLTHQGVAFDVSGNLLDGQHRLSAIAQMPDGFSVEMMVTRNLPPKAFDVLDIGVKRNAGDVLRVSSGVAAVARFMALIVETDRVGITPTLLIPYVSGVQEPYQELVSYAPSVSKTWSSAAVRTAAILRLLSGGDRDYVLLSYHAVLHAEYDAMSRIVQALYRQQMQGKVRGSMDLFARAYKAFDIRKASLDTIQISDHSAVVGEARDLIQRNVLGQKKAGVEMPAKKVKKPDSIAKGSAMAFIGRRAPSAKQDA